MREILFRVWDEDNRCYHTGWDGTNIIVTFFNEEDKDGNIGFMSYKTLDCACEGCGGCVDTWIDLHLDEDSIIEQYIGINDKKGNKIFEGDVLCGGDMKYYGCKSNGYEFELWKLNNAMPQHISISRFMEITGTIHD